MAEQPVEESAVRGGLVGLLPALALDALLVGGVAAAGGVHMARHPDRYGALATLPNLTAGAIMLALAVLLVQVAHVRWSPAVDWRTVLLAFAVAVLPAWSLVLALSGRLAGVVA
ncbi:hypothetical protein G5V59_15805 [Nocardioides sp. W3-2-3]|uniref:hypothetical protein n=1 Tax=Nocardioides convexus TaxID=2712224 RepID=UPI002418A00D|nr:hypothetical protein [Nocardioides convexus]NHA00889.1 hypothetical protein [Nocardioides convexus]